VTDARRRSPPRLSRAIPPADAFRAIALDLLDAAIATAGDPTAPAVERIHAVRTACKRLRALLRLVRTAFPGFERENHALRDAAAGLAGIRDAAVMDNTLARLPRADRNSAPGLVALIAARAPGEEDEQAALARFAEAAGAIRTRAIGWTLTAQSYRPFVRGVASTYQRAYADMEIAAESGRPRDFHEWRKQTKYLLNQLELLSGLGLKSARRRKPLEKLGDLLGRQHDLQVLGDFAAAEMPDHAARLQRVTDRERKKLARKSLRRARDVFVDKPKKWRARLEHELKD
jgi:CHAD domain-containing protein